MNFIIELLLKSTLLLIIAWFVVQFLKNCAAGVRHWWLTGMVVLTTKITLSMAQASGIKKRVLAILNYQSKSEFWEIRKWSFFILFILLLPLFSAIYPVEKMVFSNKKKLNERHKEQVISQIIYQGSAPAIEVTDRVKEKIDIKNNAILPPEIPTNNSTLSLPNIASPEFLPTTNFSVLENINSNIIKEFSIEQVKKTTTTTTKNKLRLNLFQADKYQKIGSTHARKTTTGWSGYDGIGNKMVTIVQGFQPNMKLNSFNFHLRYNLYENTNFKLHMYHYKKDRLFEITPTKGIAFEIEATNGWIKVDIEKFNLSTFKGNVLVVLEVVDTQFSDKGGGLFFSQSWLPRPKYQEKIIKKDLGYWEAPFAFYFEVE